MLDKEIEFIKYNTRGAYHWEQISLHPVKRNAFVIGRYKNVISILKKGFNDNLSEKSVLDIGCGDGVLSYLITTEGGRVSGVDYSDLAISLARKKTIGAKIDFTVGSAYELPYADNSFDAVVSSDVIEHLQEVKIFLQEIKRVVKIGGIVVISTPIRFTEKPLDVMHAEEWFPEEYKKIIEEIFPHSKYYYSHPLFWMEMLNHSKFYRVLINLVSFIKNPFEGFKSNFRYFSLQYSSSKKDDF